MWTEESLTQLDELWTGSEKTQQEIADALGKPKSSTAWKAHDEAMRRSSRPLITDLRHDQCKWPLGPLLAEPGFFCGAPREFPDLPSNPYCAKHRRMAVAKR